MRSRTAILWLALITAPLAACGTTASGGGGADTSDTSDTSDTQQTDTAKDSTTDATADTTTDAASVDTTTDAVTDAGPDLTTDATADAGPDAVKDIVDVQDSLADVAPDSAIDAAADSATPPDAAADTQVGPDQCTVEQSCKAGMCYFPGESIGCGMCQKIESSCEADADCTKGDICKAVKCACSPATTCQPGCKADTECGDGQFCAPDFHCTPMACKNVGGQDSCPANFLCDTPSKPHCVRMGCMVNANCKGFCVKGNCYSEPGFCSYPPP